MENTKLFILFTVLIGVAQSESSGSDTALYLTPLLERGQTSLAKNLSKVNYSEMNGVTSHAGYLTVNKTYDSNMFFWFFPAKNVSSPVLLYLAGGPGISGVYGYFMEGGPYFINKCTSKLEAREFTWHANHSVLYIDNPIGTGFSYTNDTAGYSTNETEVGTNLLIALRQFFNIFSEYRPNPFFIVGESYAGKYIPAIGHAIYMYNKNTSTKNQINLKGIAIGDGIVYPKYQLQIGELLHEWGFIDEKDLKTFKTIEKNAFDFIEAGNFPAALFSMSQLINTPNCLFNNLTGYNSPHHALKPNGYNLEFETVTDFMQTSGIEKYLHVGNNTFVSAADGTVLSFMYNDIEQSVDHWVAELIDHNFKVFLYSGQLDLLAGCRLTENYLMNMKFIAADQYKAANRSIYTVKNEISGYYKVAGGLTQMCLRLAGHLVPIDQPEWFLDMLLRLTYGEGF